MSMSETVSLLYLYNFITQKFWAIKPRLWPRIESFSSGGQEFWCGDSTTIFHWEVGNPGSFKRLQHSLSLVLNIESFKHDSCRAWSQVCLGVCPFIQGNSKVPKLFSYFSNKISIDIIENINQKGLTLHLLWLLMSLFDLDGFIS